MGKKSFKQMFQEYQENKYVHPFTCSCSKKLVLSDEKQFVLMCENRYVQTLNEQQIRMIKEMHNIKPEFIKIEWEG